MANDIYITQLPGSTKSDELAKFLEEKLNVKCSASVKNGKIQGTNIAFCSVGGKVQDAIEKVNNAEFKGQRIKVMKYVKTEKNRRYTLESSPGGLKDKNDMKKTGLTNDTAKSPTQVVNGKQSTTLFTGVMVHISSVDEFYVQVVTDCNLLQLVNSQMTLLDHGTNAHRAKTLTVGQVYATRYSVDGKFYRALLLSEEAEGKVEVRFADFGNNEKVNAESIVTIDEDIAKLDFVAKRCCLFGCKVVDNEKATELLRNAGDQFQIERHKERTCGDRFKVWEVDLLDDNGRSLREHLIGIGCIKADLQTPPVFGNLESDVAESPCLPNNTENCVVHVIDEDAISPNATCIITHVESAESFYVQGAFSKQLLSTIYECLLKIEELPIVKISNILPNRLYCAMFSLDGKWYRCRIKLNANSKHVVDFVDFGNSETLYGDIRNLPDEIAAIRPQALKCHLTELRITSHEKVKAELMNLANAEVSIRCHIQKESEETSAAIDFSVESKYRSFCSWLIEQRMAERLYKHSQANISQSAPKVPQTNFVPHSVVKRNRGLDVSPRQNKKSYPRGPVKNLSPQSPSSRSSACKTSDTDPGIPVPARERTLQNLTEEFDNALKLRIQVKRWRSIHGVQSNEMHDGSLLDQLEDLQKLKDEDDDLINLGSGDSTKDIHRKLLNLRRAAMCNEAGFHRAIKDLSDILASGTDDEAVVLAKSEERDQLAESVIKTSDEFVSNFSGSKDTVEKRVSEMRDCLSKIDYLLGKCTSPMATEEDFTENGDCGQEIWNKFSSSGKLLEAIQATDSASHMLENSRRAISFITDLSGVDEPEAGPEIMKSFFPNLLNLNTAMQAELDTCMSQFLSDDSEKKMSSYLLAHQRKVRNLLEDLLSYEGVCIKMLHWKEEAKDILSARSAMNDETVESMENTSKKMKKARSQLRHLLADLEDAIEADVPDQSVEKLRQSIDAIRLELHSYLQTEMEQKEFISHALNLRPEISLQLSKRLKFSGSIMCNKDFISSWETSYFDIKPIDSEKTLYVSRFGEKKVMIKKLVITDDGSEIRRQLKLYQEVSSAPNSCLLPVTVAFVPPKETHVLYIVMPAFGQCDTPTTSIDSLKVIQSFLQGFHELRDAGLLCDVREPLRYIVKETDGDRILLKPSIVFEASSLREDVSKAVSHLKESFDTSHCSDILENLTSLDAIPSAVSRITVLLEQLALDVEQTTTTDLDDLDRVNDTELSVKLEDTEHCVDDRESLKIKHENEDTDFSNALD